MSSELVIFDAPASVADWYAIDDRIMGGVSQSRLRYERAGYDGVAKSKRARQPCPAPTRLPSC